MSPNCPFCQPDADRIVLENETGIALRDRFPLTEGHTLVVPRGHVASIFDLSAEEQEALWELVGQVRHRLQTELQPDGFNVGVNDGPAAGQTVMCAHIHIIPRHQGDSTGRVDEIGLPITTNWSPKMLPVKSRIVVIVRV
jgi:diadenosine tetraphosphate (Ap4A) HIT family hydrolase